MGRSYFTRAGFAASQAEHRTRSSVQKPAVYTIVVERNRCEAFCKDIKKKKNTIVRYSENRKTFLPLWVISLEQIAAEMYIPARVVE